MYTIWRHENTPFKLKFKFLIWGKEKWLKVYIARDFDHKNKKNNCFLWLILGNLVEPITSWNGDNQLGMILKT